MIFTFKDLVFFILAILLLHSNSLYDRYVASYCTYEFHYSQQIARNFGEFTTIHTNFAKVKLHLKYILGLSIDARPW